MTGQVEGPVGESPAEELELAEAQGYREALTGEKGKSTRLGAKLFWLLLSAGFFVMLRGMENIRSTLLAFIPVLMLHESGHLLAMKLCRYRDASFFFIPLLGAAAVARPVRPTQTKNAFIAIMGPLPGLILAAMLIFTVDLRQSELLVSLVDLLVILNLFNLLPLSPLDGARLLEATLFSRFRWTAFPFLLAGPLGLLVLALGSGETWLAVFSVLMLFGSVFEIKTTNLSVWLKKGGLGREFTTVDSLSDVELMCLVDEIKERFRSITDTNLVRVLKRLEEKRALVHSSILSTLGMVAAYLVLLVVGAALLYGSQVVGASADPLCGDLKASEWVARLDHSDPTVRKQAANALEQALMGNDIRLQIGVLRAMGGVGPKGLPMATSLARPQVEVLAPMLNRYLGHLFDGEGRESGVSGDSWLIGEAYGVLCVLGRAGAAVDPGLPKTVARGLEHPDAQVRQGAAAVLSWYCPAAAELVPRLIRAKKWEKDQAVREQIDSTLQVMHSWVTLQGAAKTGHSGGR